MNESPKLETIADGLWGAEWDLAIGGVMNFRGRMTVVQLGGGGLLLHSPIPIDDVLAERIADLGNVEHIVAPSCLHHLHVPKVRARYPDATIWGAPKLAAKLPDLPLDRTLEDPAPADWPKDLELVSLEGNNWMGEVVFFHPRSQTLVVTDLLFNIHDAKGWFTRLVLRSVGAFRKPAQSMMVRLTTKDKPAFARSIERVLSWNFVRLIPAHGVVVENDAHTVLRQQVAWLPARELAPSV